MHRCFPEFVNTGDFRKFGWPVEVDELKDRLDGTLVKHGSSL